MIEVKKHTLLLFFLILGLKGTQGNNQAVTQKIAFTNNIQRKDTSKTKFFMRHYPEKFTIKINGIPLDYNETKEIPVINDNFTIEYSYVWSAPWGKITGTKQVTFKINEKTPKKIELNFTSWDDEYRISASGAEAIEIKIIESSGNRKKPSKRRGNRKKSHQTCIQKPMLQPNNNLTLNNKKKLCEN